VGRGLPCNLGSVFVIADLVNDKYRRHYRAMAVLITVVLSLLFRGAFITIFSFVYKVMLGLALKNRPNYYLIRAMQQK